MHDYDITWSFNNLSNWPVHGKFHWSIQNLVSFLLSPFRCSIQIPWISIYLCDPLVLETGGLTCDSTIIWHRFHSKSLWLNWSLQWPGPVVVKQTQIIASPALCLTLMRCFEVFSFTNSTEHYEQTSLLLLYLSLEHCMHYLVFFQMQP